MTASVAILLLPFVATPLSWVAVELLIRHTSSSGKLATDTVNIELPIEERNNPPVRQNASVPNYCDRMQAAEDMTKENHPSSLNAVPTVATTERINSFPRLNGNNSRTAANKEFQNTLAVPPRVDAVEAKERRPTALLKTVQFLEADVYDVQPHRVDYSKFQSLNKAACDMVYIALMCFSLSIVCCKFSYTCSFTIVGA